MQARNVIAINDFLTENQEPDSILKTLKAILKELKRIEKREINSNLSKESLDEILNIFEQLKNNIKFVIELCDGSISRDEWYETSFDGDFKGELWHIVDSIRELETLVVIDKNHKSEYFLTIK